MGSDIISNIADYILWYAKAIVSYKIIIYKYFYAAL